MNLSNSFFLSRIKKRTDPNCNVLVQKSGLKKPFFRRIAKKGKRDKYIWTLGPNVRQGFKARSQNYQRNILGIKDLFLELCNFVYFFRVWSVNFRIFGAKSNRSSRRIPKNHPRKAIFGQEKNGNWATFFRTSAICFAGVVKSAM